MKFLTGAVFFVISFSCFSNSLSFNDFPCKSVSSAYVNKLIAGSSDYSELYIKDANRSLLEGKVNFNGHYVVFVTSCGGGCIYGGIVDKTSGKLIDFPDAFSPGDDDDQFELKYKKESSLICFDGISLDSGESGQKCYAVYGDRLERVAGLLREE